MQDNEFLVKKAASLVNEATRLALQIAPESAVAPQSRIQSGYFAAGLKDKKRSGTGSQFWQFRSYQSGDTPRLVDWKRTARGDALIIKEREHEQADLYRFWVDPLLKDKISNSLHRARKYETSMLLALALAHLVHLQEDRSLTFSLQSSRSGHGYHTLEAHALEFLSEINPNLANLKNIKCSAAETVFLFSDFWLPTETLKTDLLPLLQHFKRGFLIQISEPEELNFPFVGRTMFKPSSQSDWTYKIEDAAAVRAIYLERIQIHQAELARLCRINGWEFLSFSTSEDQRQILGRLAQKVMNSG